ncbi:MAG: amidohydrolase [Selenomonadales bacterium]|nr:amidohydrolase [Selenomonadales bacterium]
MSRILLKNAHYFSTDGTAKQGDIAIENDIILSVGESAAEDWTPDRTIECKDKFVIPGFINTHTHAAMGLFRSYADDMLLMDWLQKKIWPIEGKMESDDFYWGTMLGIAEMIQSGTTMFADMYMGMERVAEAVEETGIRAVIARGMAGVAPTAESALVNSEYLYNTYHGAADGRLRVMLGPHAPYTCPPDYLKRVVALSEKLGAEIHIHLAETQGEVNDCLRLYGKTPMALMDEVGLLDRGVLAAHCVVLSEEDIALMAAKNVRVAHNPGSNMKLASGIAPVPALLKAGVCVGLGTDGSSSNNNLDMLEEVHLAALLHKVNTLDPLAVPAHAALRMGTTDGAVALGVGDTIGRIEAGYQADLTIFDMDQIAWTPRHDLVSLLVYAANSSHVDTVMVAGKILMENRQLTTIDEERVKFETNRSIKRLLQA